MRNFSPQVCLAGHLFTHLFTCADTSVEATVNSRIGIAGLTRRARLAKASSFCWHTAIFGNFQGHLRLYGPSRKVEKAARVFLSALADKNEQRLFFARDVVGPLSTIMAKEYRVPAFARHLKEFCQESHGPVLDRRGPPRKIQYRFVTPLMEPYVILRGLADRLITETQLTHPSANSNEPEQLSLLGTV